MKTLAINSLVVAVLTIFLVGNQGSWAASHSDAPLIKQDPQANITDVYTFVGTKYNDPDQRVLNVVTHVRPFSEPGDGVIYDRFADDALYSIHISNPMTGKTALRYNFRFSDVNPRKAPGLKNPNTILSYGLGTDVGAIQDIGDSRQNFSQSYAVNKLDSKSSKIIGSKLLTPPPNVGANTTPSYNDDDGRAISGATTFAELDSYTQQAIYNLPSGEAVFAGPREDGFYADIPAIFDLLDGRILGEDGLGQNGNGVDGFKGYNVLAYGIQIPVDSLSDVPGFPIVGVHASVSRKRITLRRTNKDPISLGPWVQVNRMGNPVFNEALVALQDKDKYNRTSPKNDAALFAKYAENPEIAKLINIVVFGGDEVLPESGRSDLVSIYIPDVIRVDTSTDPVPLAGQADFNRLGVFGGDTTNGVPSGWPNGRRFGDDVIDIALTAVAAGAVPVLGDNINANDQLYHQVFPYSATPHSGTTNRKDPEPLGLNSNTPDTGRSKFLQAKKSGLGLNSNTPDTGGFEFLLEEKIDRSEGTSK